jgi:hypothetical protein
VGPLYEFHDLDWYEPATFAEERRYVVIAIVAITSPAHAALLLYETHAAFLRYETFELMEAKNLF